MPVLIRRYLLPILMVGAATLATSGLFPLSHKSVFLLFSAAIVGSALVGGLLSGLFATLLAMIACDLFFLPPLYSFAASPRDHTALLLFGATGILISVAIQTLHTYRANLERARDGALEAQEQMTLLVQVSKILRSSIDYSTVLDGVSRTVMHRFADLCLIDVFEDGELRRLSVAHSDWSKSEVAALIGKTLSHDVENPQGPATVFLTGQPVMIGQTASGRQSQTKPGFEALEQCGFGSFLSVPLFSSGGKLGALTLARDKDRIAYCLADLYTATELASHLSAAIVNTQLYRAACAEREDSPLK